jgi:hypothetical protein
MNLRFTSTALGKTSGTLEFYFNGVGSPVVVKLIGEGIDKNSAQATLQPGSSSSYPGSTVDIPIILSNANNLGIAGVTGFDATLNYNSTVLSPVGYSVTIVDDTTSSILLKDLPAIQGELIKIKFAVALGNTENSLLVLSNVITKGGIANVNLLDGTFNLLGVCHQGGARLINPNGKIQLLSIQPNPANSSLTINYQLIEKGKTEFLLVNNLGETVRRITFNEVNNFSENSVLIDMNDLSSGQYFLILKTPTMIESEKVMLLK